jgi:threonine dehydratase
MGVKLGVEEINKAAAVLDKVVFHTALQQNFNLSEKHEASIFLKREDLQKVRSYKLRGAYYKMATLDKTILKKGVVCVSAGNHAQGVAYSCHDLQVKGYIFMPSTTPKQKINQVKMFGKGFIEVILTGDTFDDSYAEARSFCEERQLEFIHPFNDLQVAAGQGTVAKEILEQIDEAPDYIFVPVGGGGLISGVVSYAKVVSPKTKIIGVEPDGAASMYQALKKGEPVILGEMSKFVDGTAVKRVGDLNFELAKSSIDDMIIVPEGKVCSTIIDLYNEEAIVVEPAGALTIAALDFYKEKIKDKSVVCIVSGSNNDLGRMQEIKERSLLYEGLKHYFIIRFPQRAGALKEFVNDVLGPNDDITRFEYAKKSIREAGPAMVGVELKQTKDYEPLIARMKAQGIDFRNINNDPSLFEYFI